jgi:transposase
MAPPYILAIQTMFKNADELLCFDRFHVASLFNRAVDVIRRQEAAAYPKKENPFSRTRYEWLKNSGKTDNRSAKRRRFLELVNKPFETAKAWRLKEHASRLWEFKRESSAQGAWRKLIWRLSHSRNGELKKLGETVKKHLRGILNAILLRANNGIAEARNSCIQQVKRMAYGFRNWVRFNREILFQYGRLNMAF